MRPIETCNEIETAIRYRNLCVGEWPLESNDYAGITKILVEWVQILEEKKKETL